MGKLKILANNNDILIKIPYSQEELKSLNLDYFALSPIELSKKYRHILFRPCTLTYNGNSYDIQYNFCTNPFCNHFGKEQEKFESLKGKPSRYKIVGNAHNKNIQCNDNSIIIDGVSLNCTSDTFSNWSICEEIKRLQSINTIVDMETEYEFHKENCPCNYATPFSDNELFYKRGKSSSNSQKYQCKTCKKITNVLPTNRESFSYHQKKNNILPLFAELIVSRTPVKRTCEILKISPKTYYHKLEWLYRKCLEFLEKNETRKLRSLEFDKMWLNTDKMIYHLNNVRRKGKGGLNYEDTEELRFQTALIASSDVNSRYVFRADIAYDYTIEQEDIEIDSKTYHDDHLYGFCRKNDRLRFSYAPQSPTPKDTQNYNDYIEELNKFNKRKEYIEGMHVNSTYTAIAHFFLIKQMLNCKKWVVVSDEDSSLITSIMRVYSDEIKNKNLHYFLCKIDKSLDKKTKFKLYTQAYGDIKSYIASSTNKSQSLHTAQISIIETLLNSHTFYDNINKSGYNFLQRTKNFIEHPLPTISEGKRYIGCVTDTTYMSSNYLAKYLVNVNNHSVDAFFNQIRRRVSILERPLVTASTEGKSYIYSNYNPKYAQYFATILRTFYNFCWAQKSSNGNLLTPAQRLGLVDKKYEYKDIIYFN